MADTINIFWFRRDLRLNDNVGLYHALNSNHPVLPIFIFDEDILESLPKDDARVTFIHNTLNTINNSLKETAGSSIAMFHKKPLEVFKQLSETYTINTVYTNHDYEPYAIKRDKVIHEFLKTKNGALKSFKDQVIFETNEIVKNDGTPYQVFTPYSKKWIETLNNNPIKNYKSETALSQLVKSPDLPFLTLKEIGFEPSEQNISPFNISEDLIQQYEATRNFPAKKGTSKLGPHLRFGTVSIRKMVQEALKSDNITFLKELIWREFFMQILWHFPHTITKSFKPKYDAILWRNNEEELNAWRDGNTGYPLVDAGMRELNATGLCTTEYAC